MSHFSKTGQLCTDILSALKNQEAAMNESIVKEMTRRSFAGDIKFPEVVRQLAEAGVERYLMDFATRMKITVGTDGSAYTYVYTFDGGQIGDAFDETGVVSALRATQRGEIQYQEFLRAVMKAGCTGYAVMITGRRALYFGRRGEVYVEVFPPQK
jgi:uncharacterized protein YbcV (DUF1398 family)